MRAMFIEDTLLELTGYALGKTAMVSGKHAADFTVILIVPCPFMRIH
jgi:hypothetical protein